VLTRKRENFAVNSPLDGGSSPQPIIVLSDTRGRPELLLVPAK
jgi:hypothetical protein